MKIKAAVKFCLCSQLRSVCFPIVIILSLAKSIKYSLCSLIIKRHFGIYGRCHMTTQILEWALRSLETVGSVVKKLWVHEMFCLRDCIVLFLQILMYAQGLLCLQKTSKVDRYCLNRNISNRKSPMQSTLHPEPAIK